MSWWVPVVDFLVSTNLAAPLKHFLVTVQEHLEKTIQDSSKRHEPLGDSVAWGGCCIMYLLGQQLHFELFDFSYQFLNVAEVESATITQQTPSERSKTPNSIQVGPAIAPWDRSCKLLSTWIFLSTTDGFMSFLFNQRGAACFFLNLVKMD